MSQPSMVGGHGTGLGATTRADAWWVEPVGTGLFLAAAILYLTFAGLQGSYYHAGPYLSPLYSPLLWVDASAPGAAPVDMAIFGAWPAWWPSFLPTSPAIFLVIFPTAFRGTCYYYRKAYYRAFFGMPPACAVGPVPHNYRGETFLLVFQNLHRYALYFAILLLPVLFYEAFASMSWDGKLGIGLGTVILFINASLLTGYTLGCHAWRHLIGGNTNCFSCDGGTTTAYKAWSFTSWLNERHMQFAWASLGFFCSTELYIRLLSMGVLPDVNTWQGITWLGGH